MPMKNPPHPGDLIRTEVIEALGLSVSKAAEILKVRRATSRPSPNPLTTILNFFTRSIPLHTRHLLPCPPAAHAVSLDIVCYQ